MVSRLYVTTRPLFQQVVALLLTLPLRLPPGRLERLALYVAGLILLDRDQTACRITHYLPGRAHDALNYLLRRARVAPQSLMQGLAQWTQSLGAGFFCLDDVVVEKPWSVLLPWVGWTYSTTRKQKVRGLVIVVMFWSNGVLRIPISFRLWKPKKHCSPGEYRTKIDLAQEMVEQVLGWGLRPSYIVFDAWYNARRFTRFLKRRKLIWVSVLKSNARLRCRGRRVRLGCFLRRLSPTTSMRGFRIQLPGYGKAKLVVVRHGSTVDYLVTNALRCPPEEVMRRKKSRWDAEESFRESKQLAGLEACQCWVPQAMERHIALVLLAFMALQMSKKDPSETAGQVKERFHLFSLTGNSLPTCLASQAKTA